MASAGYSSVPVRLAFDRHADDYDDRFSGNRLARESRKRTWQVLDSLYASGDRVIDLGCGTGEDAVHLARRGVSVLGVDLSGRMIDRVREKVRRARLGDRIECRVADFTNIDLPDGVPRYGGLYSNFGALNCIPGLDWLPGIAARLLEPGASLVLVLMSPFYPLETGANLLARRWQSAVRWRPSATTATVRGVQFAVCYPGLGKLRRALGPRFVLERSEALNLLTPVPGLDHLDLRFGSIFRRSGSLDRWLSRQPVLRGCGDHFMSVWRYRGDAR